MAGIGKYKKGAKFTLKSGNKPTFMQMGSSPANMNNFGIGQGASPYHKNDENDENDTSATADDKSTDKTTKDTTKEQGGEAEKADPTWKKALKIGTTLLSGGIQGVYGGRREYPKINYGKKAKEPTTTPQQKVKVLTAGADGETKKPFSETYNPKHEDGTWKTVEEFNKEYEEYNKAQ